MKCLTLRTYFAAKKLCRYCWIGCVSFVFIVGLFTTLLIAWNYENAAILLGDFARIKQEERIVQESLRTQKK